MLHTTGALILPLLWDRHRKPLSSALTLIASANACAYVHARTPPPSEDTDGYCSCSLQCSLAARLCLEVPSPG